MKQSIVLNRNINWSLDMRGSSVSCFSQDYHTITHMHAFTAFTVSSMHSSSSYFFFVSFICVNILFKSSFL